MTNLARRDERQQRLAAEVTKTRDKRDEALARLVRLETKLRSLEKSERSFRESTKKIRARLLAEIGAKAEAEPLAVKHFKEIAAKPEPVKPVRAKREKTVPEIEPPGSPKPALEPMPGGAPLAIRPITAEKAAALRAELRGERQRKRH